MKDLARSLLRTLGFELRRVGAGAPTPLMRRRILMERAGIDLVLDVGANVGQYAKGLRKLGYTGRIVSFEPMAAAFAELRRSAEADPRWTCFNHALGDADGPATINVSENSVSSSMRPILAACVKAAPKARYVGEETIEVRRLDAIFDEIVRPADNAMLKIDTQGFEKQVLAGAARSLAAMRLLQVEASLTPLYDGEAPMGELVVELGRLGLRPLSIEEGFQEPATGRLLQVDLIFGRA